MNSPRQQRGEGDGTPGRHPRMYRALRAWTEANHACEFHSNDTCPVAHCGDARTQRSGLQGLHGSRSDTDAPSPRLFSCQRTERRRTHHALIEDARVFLIVLLLHHGRNLILGELLVDEVPARTRDAMSAKGGVERPRVKPTSEGTYMASVEVK